jgi:hypothetical protein
LRSVEAFIITQFEIAENSIKTHGAAFAISNFSARVCPKPSALFHSKHNIIILVACPRTSAFLQPRIQFSKQARLVENVRHPTRGIEDGFERSWRRRQVRSHQGGEERRTRLRRTNDAYRSDARWPFNAAVYLVKHADQNGKQTRSIKTHSPRRQDAGLHFRTRLLTCAAVYLRAISSQARFLPARCLGAPWRTGTGA